MPEINHNNSAGRREPQPPSGGRQAPKAKARKQRRRPLILTILLRFFQIIGTLLLIGVITGSFLVCYAAVYVKTVVMPKTYLNLDEYTLSENSIIYYENKATGQWEELQTLMGDENREIVSYTDIPQDLINAFVAIEDKRFWVHDGVDWRRTANGMLRMFTGGNIQGGSTITQQLIKNLTTYDDVTVTRKIQEIFTALELDKNYDKETILTVYFNYIYMGNKCYGVQAASQYYFGKDVWDLNLAECASLAGITNNPSLYAPYGVVEMTRYKCQNPGCPDPYSNEKETVCGACGAENSFDNGTVWTNREFNKARQELILREMAKTDEDVRPIPYITEAERDAAIAQPLVFGRDLKADGEDPNGAQAAKPATARYSWYVEAVIDDAIEALMEARSINWEAANQLVFNSGLSIYTSYDPTVQSAVDTIFNDRSNLDQVSSRTGQRLMSAITVVDNSSGYVVAIGNTIEKTGDRVLNPAVHSTRQPGSSIKPLSVYSPALEMGLITPASVIDDCPGLLNGRAWPVNVTPTYRGLTTVMEGLTRSLNTVSVNVLKQVTTEKSYEFLEDVYGITTLEPGMVASNGDVLSDNNLSPLAMGGLTHGVTTFEMAAAFATFPRGGDHTPATTIVEIKDAADNTIADNSNTTENVIKPSTAYYINTMLSNAVTSPTGTAGAARISGQTVAGKTGTTQNTFDYYFCGYTTHYTAAVWTGYNNGEVINYNYYNPSISLWQKVMNIVHQGLENQAFDVPGDLSTYDICIDCGKLASGACASDPRGSRVQSFRLLSGDGPTEACICHVPVQVCMESPILDADGVPTGYFHQAGEFCPEESVATIAFVDYERDLTGINVSVGDQLALLSSYHGGTCQVHLTAQPSGEPTESPDIEDPEVSDPQPVETDSSVEPTTSIPPFVEPTNPPMEPTTEPPINIDPPPITDPPYIPAGDPNQPVP